MSCNHIIVEDYPFIFDISSCVFYNDLDNGNYDRRGRDLQVPFKSGQGEWQGQRALGQTQLLIARLSGYANIARPDANTGVFASTLQIHDIPLQKLPFLEPWKFPPQNEEKYSVSVLR